VAELSVGEAMVARIIRDLAEHEQIEPDQRYLELFAEAAAIKDRIERIKVLIAEQGETVTLRDGRLIMHPGICEIRLQQAALVKVLDSMHLTADGKNAKAQHAANVRWRAHNEAKKKLEAI
jgi:hypothetical protein